MFPPMVIRHPGHPVLSWCADNLTVTNNSYGEIRPDKSLAIERIDGMVALIMALGRAIAHPAPLVSKYETTDLYVL